MVLFPVTFCTGMFEEHVVFIFCLPVVATHLKTILPICSPLCFQRVPHRWPSPLVVVYSSCTLQSVVACFYKCSSVLFQGERCRCGLAVDVLPDTN